MAEPTVGPYVVEWLAEERVWAVCSPDRKVILAVMGNVAARRASEGSVVLDQLPTEANAQLFAASWELLKVCEELFQPHLVKARWMAAGVLPKGSLLERENVLYWMPPRYRRIYELLERVSGRDGRVKVSHHDGVNLGGPTFELSYKMAQYKQAAESLSETLARVADDLNGYLHCGMPTLETILEDLRGAIGPGEGYDPDSEV